MQTCSKKINVDYGCIVFYRYGLRGAILVMRPLRKHVASTNVAKGSPLMIKPACLNETFIHLSI